MPSTNEQTATIQKQNDAFRQFPSFSEFYGMKGKILITSGISSLPDADQTEILNTVREFNDFSEENDPYGTHEFGAFDCKGNKIFWKIDCYDLNYEMGSPDPTDLDKTRRVLTILLASEY